MQGRSRCSGGSLQSSIPEQGIVPASPHQAPHLPGRLLWESSSALVHKAAPRWETSSVLLGFCVAVPRGWDQLCLSPNLKAMWTSLQESPRPSPGVNTSSLTTPRRFSTACAFTLLFISPPQGSVQFLPRGICSAQIMQCLAKDTEGPSVLSLLTSTGHPSLGTLPTLSVEIGSKHSCPKGPDLTRPHETPCPQGQQTRHKPKAPVA